MARVHLYACTTSSPSDAASPTGGPRRERRFSVSLRLSFELGLSVAESARAVGVGYYFALWFVFQKRRFERLNRTGLHREESDGRERLFDGAVEQRRRMCSVRLRQVQARHDGGDIWHVRMWVWEISTRQHVCCKAPRKKPKGQCACCPNEQRVQSSDAPAGWPTETISGTC